MANDWAGSEVPESLWYVAYGSNLSASRFRCYLEGGRAPGSSRENPGCRDPRPPRAVRPVELPYVTYFHGWSSTWHGGVALLDHQRIDHQRVDPEQVGGGATLGRGYLITVEQFADVMAQESRRPVGGPLPEGFLAALAAPAVPAAPAEGRPRSIGTGWYDTVVPLDPIDGHPAATFTASWGRADADESPPSPAYRAVIEAGLIEAWGLTAADAAAYVDERAGV